jgi:uncharacterized protein with NRDE domain
MCLVAIAIDQSRRFPLVIATNRDEFFDRPASRLAWWTPAEGGPAILGGRDLDSGGTWLGLTTQGRLGLVTNVRDQRVKDPAAPSRGQIVPEWLAARERVDRFWMRTALRGYSGFNLIAADFAAGECFWGSNQAAQPLRLERGVYGLSNAALDTPWPKVTALKARLGEALAADSVDALSGLLFSALGDRSLAAEDALPQTGLPRDRERELSAAFIRTPDQRYGTRCSTLVIAERSGRHLVTHVLERSYGANPAVALLRRATLRHWPPRYNRDDTAAQQGPVHEAEVGLAADARPVPVRTRVRSLLKPDAPRRRPPAPAPAPQ